MTSFQSSRAADRPLQHRRRVAVGEDVEPQAVAPVLGNATLVARQQHRSHRRAEALYFDQLQLVSAEIETKAERSLSRWESTTSSIARTVGSEGVRSSSAWTKNAATAWNNIIRTAACRRLEEGVNMKGSQGNDSGEGGVRFILAKGSVIGGIPKEKMARITDAMAELLLGIGSTRLPMAHAFTVSGSASPHTRPTAAPIFFSKRSINS